MAPKALPELRLPGIRKRTIAPSLADPDNVDAAAIKRRKLEADLRQQRQPSVETVPNDNDNSSPPNNPPRKASNILEAADGSDDDESMGDASVEEFPFAPDSSDVGDRDGGNDDDNDTEDTVEEEEESEEAELGEHLCVKNGQNLTYILYQSERLTCDWVSPIYAFFGRVPDITYNSQGRRAHEFRCAATHCKGRGLNGRIVHRFLDTTDCKSTSNLKRHATACWGPETVNNALESKVDIKTARRTLSNMKDGSITTSFERKGKGKFSYSHRQHSKAETR